MDSYTTSYDSSPGLTRSGHSLGSDIMDLDSRPLEDHQIRVQAYGLQLQADQVERERQRQQQEQFYQQQQYQHQQLLLHQQQQQLQLQHQQLQQQPYQPYQQHQFNQSLQQPYSLYSLQSEKPIYQQQQANQTLNHTNEGETEMPSLSFSNDEHSTTAGSTFMSTSPRVDNAAGGAGAGAGGFLGDAHLNVNANGMEEDGDQDFFLTSVLSMVQQSGVLNNNGAPPLSYFDYDTEFVQKVRLGKGGNGEIKRAFWTGKQCTVILKNLLETKNTATKNAILFDKEVEVMRLCGTHENLVQFYGVANSKKPDCPERSMVMHYYPQGDLVKLFEKASHPLELPTLDERLLLAMDIALGLNHLFRCGFHHGDLHPKNILIDKRRSGSPSHRYQARLTDFGLRRIRDNPNAVSSQQLGGVFQFMAPERLYKKPRPRYNLQCDIFALGVLYWYLLAGRYPTKDLTTPGSGNREGRIDGTPDWYFAIYTQAWNEDPKNRQKSLDEIVDVFYQQLRVPPPTSPYTQQPISPVQQQPQQPFEQLYDSSFARTGIPMSAGTGGVVIATPHGSSTMLPGLSYDGFYGNPMHAQPSGTGSLARGGSSVQGPTMVQPSSQNGVDGGTFLHNNYNNPNQTSHASTSTHTTAMMAVGRSNNPNHPRNKKTVIPNGLPGRPGYRP